MKKILYLISLIIFSTPLCPTVPFEEMNEYDRASELRNKADRKWARQKRVIQHLQDRINNLQATGFEVNNDLKARLADAEANLTHAHEQMDNAVLNEIWARDNGLSLSYLFHYGINNSKKVAVAGLTSAIGLIYYFL